MAGMASPGEDYGLAPLTILPPGLCAWDEWGAALSTARRALLR